LVRTRRNCHETGTWTHAMHVLTERRVLLNWHLSIMCEFMARVSAIVVLVVALPVQFNVQCTASC